MVGWLVGSLVVGWLVGLVGWLVGLLVGWLVGCSVGWLVVRLVGWLVSWLVCLVGLVGWLVRDWVSKACIGLRDSLAHMLSILSNFKEFYSKD